MARSKTIRIGLSARLFHPRDGAMGIESKTLQVLEQSIAQWVMSRDVLVLMVPSILKDGPIHRSNIRLRDYADYLDGLVLQGGTDVSPEAYGETPLKDEWAGDRVRDAYEMELLHEFVEAGKPVLGICRGLQLINVAFGGSLYQDIEEQHGHPQTLRGLGLLPTRTVFTAEKRRAQVTATAAAPFAGAALTGYEIHTGRTAVNGAPFCRYADGTPEGCVQNAVFGTYLHGLFDSGELTEQLAAYLCRRKGIAPETAAPLAMADYRTQQLDLLADGVRSALDMEAVYAAMGLHNPRGGKK